MPFASQPTLTFPDGKQCELPCVHDVPMLEESTYHDAALPTGTPDACNFDSFGACAGIPLHVPEKLHPAIAASVPVVPSIDEQVQAFIATKLPNSLCVVEMCCDPDSELGKQAVSLGMFVIRITEHHDLFVPENATKFLEIFAKLPGMNLHGSLPCTSWSQFQRIIETCCSL